MRESQDLQSLRFTKNVPILIQQKSQHKEDLRSPFLNKGMEKI